MAGSSRRPLYRRTSPPRPGAVADPYADLLAIDDLIRSIPSDYPGLTQLRRRRAEIAALTYGVPAQLDLHLEGPGVTEHSTGGRSLGRFLTALVESTKEVSKSLHGLKKLSTELQVQPGPGSIRLLISPPLRDDPPAAMAQERSESAEVAGIRKIVSLFEVANSEADITSADILASLTGLRGGARRSIARLARSAIDGEYELFGSWQDPRHGRTSFRLSLAAAARLRSAANDSSSDTETATFQGEVDGWEWSSSTVKFVPVGARSFRASVPEHLASEVARLITPRGQRAEAEFTVVTRYAPDSGDVASRGYSLNSIHLIDSGQEELTGFDRR